MRLTFFGCGTTGSTASAATVDDVEADVARQVGGRNYLLNQQTDATRKEDGDKLQEIIDYILEPAKDASAIVAFKGVSRALKGDEGYKDVADFLSVANAVFYIQTGVSALEWWEEIGPEWVLMKAREKELNVHVRIELLRAAEKAVGLLAANAYGNNVKKLMPKYENMVSKRVLGYYGKSFWDKLAEKMYEDSCRKAKVSAPSCDKSAAQPPKLQGDSKAFPENTMK
ncbi:MAG: hypothetical protein HGA90_06285 [Alphaproteobacteria bacterium]|nr:hypothetical protein [Alphaproteobacteria bacterium]